MIENRNTEQLEQAIVDGFAQMQDLEVPAGASERLADFGQTVVQTYPEVLVAAGTAFSAFVARVVMVVLAVIGIGAGTYAYVKATASVDEAPPVVYGPADTERPVDEEYVFAPISSVSFIGGETVEHINPLEASASSSEGTIEQWTIRDPSGQIVLEGEGSSTGPVLRSLPNGTFTMYFSISDGRGAIAYVQRDFVIEMS